MNLSHAIVSWPYVSHIASLEKQLTYTYVYMCTIFMYVTLKLTAFVHLHTNLLSQISYVVPGITQSIT